ncbi:related to AIM1 |uniref:Related to AIM1 \|nr:related to AIM1 \
MLGILSTATRYASTRTLPRHALYTVAWTRTLTTTRALLNESATLTSTPTSEQEQTAGEQKIRQILLAKFNPSVLKVQDVSGGCGSFYAIQLSSKEFKGLSTVKAHRLVNQQLKDVIKDIHGLQLSTLAED